MRAAAQRVRITMRLGPCRLATHVRRTLAGVRTERTTGMIVKVSSPERLWLIQSFHQCWNMEHISLQAYSDR